MLKMAVGQTDEIEGRRAAEDVLRQCSAILEDAAPQCGLVLASHDLDVQEFHQDQEATCTIYSARPS